MPLLIVSLRARLNPHPRRPKKRKRSVSTFSASSARKWGFSHKEQVTDLWATPCSGFWRTEYINCNNRSFIDVLQYLQVHWKYYTKVFRNSIYWMNSNNGKGLAVTDYSEVFRVLGRSFFKNWAFQMRACFYSTTALGPWWEMEVGNWMGPSISRTQNVLVVQHLPVLLTIS